MDVLRRVVTLVCTPIVVANGMIKRPKTYSDASGKGEAVRVVPPSHINTSTGYKPRSHTRSKHENWEYAATLGARFDRGTSHIIRLTAKKKNGSCYIAVLVAQCRQRD